MPRREARKPTLSGVRWTALLFMVFALLIIHASIDQWPERMPSFDDMKCVVGEYESIEREGRRKSARHNSMLYLADGTCYRISSVNGLKRADFREKVQPDDTIRMYFRGESIYAVYDEDGEAIHSIESSYKAEVRNCYGLMIFGGIWLLSGMLVLLNTRRVYGFLLKRYLKEKNHKGKKPLITWF